MWGWNAVDKQKKPGLLDALFNVDGGEKEGTLLDALFNVDGGAEESSPLDALLPVNKEKAEPAARKKRPWVSNRVECRYCGSLMPVGRVCPGCGLHDEEAGR